MTNKNKEIMWMVFSLAALCTTLWLWDIKVDSATPPQQLFILMPYSLMTLAFSAMSMRSGYRVFFKKSGVVQSGE